MIKSAGGWATASTINYEATTSRLMQKWGNKMKPQANGEYWNQCLSASVRWCCGSQPFLSDICTALWGSSTTSSTPALRFQMCSFNLITNWMLPNTINYMKADIVTVFFTQVGCQCLVWFGQGFIRAAWQKLLFIGAVYSLHLTNYFTHYCSCSQLFRQLRLLAC